MAGRGRNAVVPAWMSTDSNISSISINNTSTNVENPPLSSDFLSITPGYVPNTLGIASSNLNILNPSLVVGASTAVPIQPISISYSATPMVQTHYPVSRSQSTGDPNNEQVNWSSHLSPDGRKYWYNNVTKVSTYDKPFCLKTPEERSIPPCKWKEYSSGDRMYYSDGIQSVWDEPEEHRLWREKVGALESKQKVQVKATNSDLKVENVVISYKNHEEALAAFNALLSDKKVTSVMKLKDIKEICESDPRWVALKTAGERNQFISEFQTKKRKQEKEALLQKAKKNRDAFLVMLAENTKIDTRTKWKDVIPILKDDSRFKQINDPVECEDLFNDFISELIKKEKEDISREKSSTISLIDKKLKELHDKEKISHRSTWNESKELVLNEITQHLSHCQEFEVKKMFQDFILVLENKVKNEERQRKEMLRNQLGDKKREFESFLYSLVDDAIIRPHDRWRDIAEMSIVTKSSQYKDIEFISNSLDLDNSRHSKSIPNYVPNVIKELIDKLISDVNKKYEDDRILVMDALKFLDIRIFHDSKAGILKDELFDRIDNHTQTDIKNTESNEATEEGEEVDLKVNKTSADLTIVTEFKRKLLNLNDKKPHQLKLIFDNLIEDARIDYEEGLKKMQKREQRFIDLLEEYFYRSDHLDITWDDAKKLLERHSSFDVLGRTDRKRIFVQYMSNLRKKMESKVKKEF